ncbi:MAG: transposase [Devosia sp.]|nr:transposase [Devosia sp.]
MSFIEGSARDQVSLLPPCVDDYVAPDALVRVVDAFVSSLNLAELGFGRAVAAATGRPGYHPGDMLRLYIWGYLNQARSSRHLERACVRDLEALWLLRQLAPDYRTIASFRHDNPDAIVAASAAFIQFCRENGLISGRLVALDGTKMRAVASPKNIAGADRLARDVAHTEKEIAYYLDRLDIMDEAVAQGFDDQPKHREAFTAAIETLGRRKDRLVRRQEILQDRDEAVLVFGEPDARPMGYGHSPKTPCYNMQSIVDVDSGLIIHHDVANEANDSQLLHPMSMAAMEVLQVEELKVLADGGYSNAQAIAQGVRPRYLGWRGRASGQTPEPVRPIRSLPLRRARRAAPCCRRLRHQVHPRVCPDFGRDRRWTVPARRHRQRASTALCMLGALAVPSFQTSGS